MKIPYGIHDYKTIKTEDYLFIDKTKFIKEIENIGKYLVFLRPRRFGKSLFSSMLYYYYDIHSSDIFDNLFHNTYIDKNKTTEANSYYILKFDFSGINASKESIEDSFYTCVYSYIREFDSKYKLDLDLQFKSKEPAAMLRDFLISFKEKTTKQIYLIIDEYDHFANNVLTADLNLFNTIIGKNGFVRSFYEVFKTYAGTVIGRMFITGVTPITLDSLTSGFNMAINITKEELLNEMLGFTQEEVMDVIEKLKIDKDNLKTLKENYNGYLFSGDASTKVYNSNMVLYYLKSFILYNKPPKSLTDSNIVSDYDKITGMFDLYKDTEGRREIINKILNNETISAEITDQFNLKLEFNKEEFLSLLYYLGLLTIDSAYGGEVNLKTPNDVIKNVYFEYYFNYIINELDIQIDVRNIKDSVKELSQNNNAVPFIRLVESFLNGLSNRDFIKFDEKYIKLLMITYFRLSSLYLVKSEYEVNGGYIDIALLPNHLFEVNNYFIFEIKYLNADNYSDKLLSSKRNEAIGQINRYADSEEMRIIAKLRKYIFVFVHVKCEVLEEVKA